MRAICARKRMRRGGRPKSLEITKKQFQAGGVSYVQLLIAERQYSQARQSRVLAQAARYADSAALFQALGGGWWNRKDQEEECEAVSSVMRRRLIIVLGAAGVLLAALVGFNFFKQHIVAQIRLKKRRRRRP